jgi:hypothetical protein
MSEADYSRIVFSERLSTGIVVHFEMGISVFFPARLLFEQREAPLSKILHEQDFEA